MLRTPLSLLALSLLVALPAQAKDALRCGSDGDRIKITASVGDGDLTDIKVYEADMSSRSYRLIGSAEKADPFHFSNPRRMRSYSGYSVEIDAKWSGSIEAQVKGDLSSAHVDVTPKEGEPYGVDLDCR